MNARDDDDLAPWADLTPEARLELVGECVLDGLRLEGKSDVPRLRRVHRVVERPSRAVPDRGGVRRRLSRTAAATKDIDVLVDRSVANARRVRSAVEEFLGGEVPNVTLAKLTNPRTLIVLGVAPVRIDILTAVDGITSFAKAWKRRVEGRYGDAIAHFVSIDDLVTSKQAAGRPQDLADLDVLRRVVARQRRKR